MKPITEYSFVSQTDGSVLVTGGTTPYVITGNGGGFTCNCSAFRFGHSCKHVARWTLLQSEAFREMVSAAPPPVTVSADGLTHIRELLAEPDDAVSWIVDGLLPAGGMSVFGGKPKGGKSTTARAIALRVCRGEAVLGRQTTKGPVIYLGLEDPRRVTKGHLRTLAARADDELYVFTGTRPTEAIVWLETVLAKVDPALVVVDTLQHLLGVSDLNDYARVVSALGPVLKLVRPRRAHMMLPCCRNKD